MANEELMRERMRQQAERLEATSPVERAKRLYADALREVIDVLNESGASEALLRDEAERVRAFAQRLRESPPAAKPTLDVGYKGMEDFFDRSPIVGLSNPLAPPAAFTQVPEEQCVRGTVEFGKAFEGGPGLVHGGFLAALLDEALGCVTIYSGSSGMTGEYTLRYHAPTRIKAPLHFEARFDRREGRKIYLSADLWDGDTRTVSATGLFIGVDGKTFAAFHADRSERLR